MATTVQPPPTADPGLATLRRLLAGEVIEPDDPSYEAARTVWNLLHVRRPALIVRPVDARDVVTALRYARDRDLEIAVRSGGHSIAGYSSGDDVLVIDLRALRTLETDAERRVAVVGTGLTAGEISAAAAEHGLAIPFGDTATVGVGGITLGGGIGYLARRHGLTIDHLRRAEIVTVDGRILAASATENPDLFWGLRGGGGNLGVVTRFEFDLVPVATVLGGALVLPATPDVLRGIVDEAMAAPRGLTTITETMPAPPAPFILEAEVGRLVATVIMVWDGDRDEGQRVVDRFRRLAPPIADLVGPMPYTGIYAYSAEAEGPMPSTARSMFLDGLDDEAIATILDRMAATARAPMASTQIRVLGGRVADVPADATAFAHRERPVMLTVYQVNEDPATFEGEVAWLHDYHARLAPEANGAYVNFLEDEGEARVRDAYPPATYARLAELKRRYDPANVLHRNQNVRPG